MKYILVPLILILLLSNCKKPPSCNGNYSALPDSVLNYWYFPKGSYWIYKAKGFELYDTATIIGNFTENIETKPGELGSGIGCGISYSSLRIHSYYGCSNGNYIEQFSSINSTFPIGLYVNAQFDTCKFIGYNESLFFQNKTNSSGIINKDTVINNIPIKNLLVNERFVLAPKIGVLEFELNDTIQWQLLTFKTL